MLLRETLSAGISRKGASSIKGAEDKGVEDNGVEDKGAEEGPAAPYWAGAAAVVSNGTG